jgi:hypothetical protein
MEGVFVIFLFVGVIAITALIFGAWIVVGIVRLVFRAIGALFVAPAPPPPQRAQVIGTIQCGSQQCRATNPSNARFCRRCGQSLPIQRVAASRRAACW